MDCYLPSLDATEDGIKQASVRYGWHAHADAGKQRLELGSVALGEQRERETSVSTEQAPGSTVYERRYANIMADSMRALRNGLI